MTCASSIPWLPAPHPFCSHPPPTLPVAPPLSSPLLQLGWGTAWGSCSCGKGPALPIPHPIVPHLFIVHGKFLSLSNAPLCQSWTLSSKVAEEMEKQPAGLCSHRSAQPFPADQDTLPAPPNTGEERKGQGETSQTKVRITNHEVGCSAVL